MKRLLFIVAILAIATMSQVRAQSVGLKTNVLYWGTTTINFGVEPALSPHSTIDIEGMWNPWQFDNNKKMKFWAVQPEYRYWLCEKFNGHFFGAHVHYAQFNYGMNVNRYDGWLVGAGVSYGYDWIINRSWRFEATVGVGYAYIDYDKYKQPKCGEYLGHYTHNYFGPTKVGLSFIYLIK